jgi:hypothetical protein
LIQPKAIRVFWFLRPFEKLKMESAESTLLIVGIVSNASNVSLGLFWLPR